MSQHEEIRTMWCCKYSHSSVFLRLICFHFSNWPHRFVPRLHMRCFSQQTQSRDVSRDHSCPRLLNMKPILQYPAPTRYRVVSFTIMTTFILPYTSSLKPYDAVSPLRVSLHTCISLTSQGCTSSPLRKPMEQLLTKKASSLVRTALFLSKHSN